MTITAETVLGFNSILAYNTPTRPAARFGNQITCFRQTHDLQTLPKFICPEFCKKNMVNGAVRLMLRGAFEIGGLSQNVYRFALLA